MNSIHEPGSRTMSKNRLKNSTESNQAKNRLIAPSAQPTGRAARPGLRAARAPCLLPRPAPMRPACVPPRPHAPVTPAVTPPSAGRLCPCQRPPAACAPCARPAPSLLLRWAVAHFRFCIPFFFFFFFISFNYWKIPKKYLFIYFLSFSSTPINLLKFIPYIFFFSFPNKPNKLLKFILFIFLFQFTHCKLQGLFSNMPMCYLPKHTNYHITHTTCHTHQTHTYNHSSIHMITHKTHMPCPSFVPCLS